VKRGENQDKFKDQKNLNLLDISHNYHRISVVT